MKDFTLALKWALAGTVAIAGLTGCGPADSGSGSGSSEKIQLAYITNGIDPFWDTAAAGVRDAEKEFDVECEVVMPPDGSTDQKRLLEAILARGVDGIAISPTDADNQVAMINDACRVTNVITHDSDAPDSDRICFIGMENYKAGREAGKLVKEALPEGGEIMLFVGRLEQLNSQQRRQGIIDELLDRPAQSLDNLEQDPVGKPIEGDKYTILDTRTDNFAYERAKSNAEDAISAYPNLKGMVGLFAYNAPACLEAVKGAGKVGEIQIVSFDEQDNTLQGIIDGSIHGTVSQQPYEYGYHSVRILAGLARDDKSVLPESGFLEIPIVTVKKDNVESFWKELKELQGKGKAAQDSEETEEAE